MIETAKGLVAACPAEEAFWLGLVAARGDAWSVRVEILLATGATVDASPAAVHVPPAIAVAGITRDEQTWWPFTRHSEVENAPECRLVEIHACRHRSATSRAVRMELVGAAEFRTLTGVPVSPLDRNASYRGWRLP